MNYSTRLGRVSFLMLALVCGSKTALAQTQNLRHDTQIWNDTQLIIPLNKKVEFVILGTLRVGRDVSTLVDERIGLGFNIKAGKYLTFTPGWFYIAQQPIRNVKTFENRLIFAVTVKGPVGKGFVLGNRSLFERRIRHPPIDATRYRDRLQVEHPFSIGDTKLNWFMADEIFYDWSFRAWVRNRFNIGVGHNFNKHVYGEVYYLRQNDGHAIKGNQNVIGTGLKFRL